MRYAQSGELAFEDFWPRLAATSDSFLEELVSALPESWQNPTNTDKIVSHIAAVRDNIPLFERGLREALA
jgi:hypothetical protein